MIIIGKLLLSHLIATPTHFNRDITGGQLLPDEY